MFEGMTPEMWALAEVIIYVQLIWWILTRFADLGMNLLTFKFLFKRKVSWVKGTGKDKGFYVKQIRYEMRPKMQRIAAAIIEGAWDASVKGIRGGFFGKNNPFIKMFGKKWGERIQVGGAMLKKYKPETYNKLLETGTSWIEQAIEHKK